MFGFGSYLLCALAAWSLWSGSLADDPNPNQCDSFCLTALRPLLSQRNIKHSVNKTQAKLNHLVGHQAMMEDQLKKLEGQLEEVHAKLEGSLLAVQNMVESQLQKVLTKMEDQMQAILAKIDAQQAAIVENKDRMRNKVPAGFDLIGSRYFRIVKIARTWTDAVRACREMGGYLAAIKDLEELKALNAKFDIGRYWLGVNNLDNLEHYISVASNNTAQYLNVVDKYAVYGPISERCLVLKFDLAASLMVRASCGELFPFICQADNET